MNILLCSFRAHAGSRIPLRSHLWHRHRLRSRHLGRYTGVPGFPIRGSAAGIGEAGRQSTLPADILQRGRKGASGVP